MNRLFKITFILFSIALLITSCKSKKKVLEPGDDIPEKSTSFLLKALGKNKVEAEWLSAKAKINYRDEYEKVKVTAHIRMRKDSVLWFAVKKANYEAVRVQITKDSVYVVNRLDKEYTIKGLDFFEKGYSLPSNFEAIQTIVLGNVLYLSNVKPESEIEDNQYHLFVEKDNVRAEYWMEGITHRLAKMKFTVIRNDRTFNMTFDEYEELEDEQNFSYFRNLNVSGKGISEVDMDIKLSKVEINVPKNIRFDIPKKYKRVD